jgi:hypothetical protein
MQCGLSSSEEMSVLQRQTVGPLWYRSDLVMEKGTNYEF